jgi:hypothetical protein
MIVFHRMKTWFFKGLDRADCEVTGTLKAESVMQAYELVRERNLLPLRVCETNLKGVEEDSYECLVLGILSLIPIVGLMASVQAMRVFHRTAIWTERGWNPLKGYLYAGFLLAWFGWLVSVGIFTLYCMSLLSAFAMH